MKRFLVRYPLTSFAVFAIASVLVLRLVWGWHNARELQKRIDALRASGQPLTYADFGLEPLSPSNNAWTYYQQAAAAIVVESPSNVRSEEFAPYPPREAKWTELAAASEQKNTAFFAAVAQAEKSPRAQLRTEAPSQLNSGYDQRGAYEIAKTLGDSAEYLKMMGDDAGALQRIESIFRLSESLDQDPTVFSAVFARGSEGDACHRIQLICPTLRIGDTSKAASRTQVMSLIARLGDEKAARQSQVRGLQCERMTYLSDQKLINQLAWLIAPLVDQDSARQLDRIDLMIRAAEANNAADARGMISALPDEYANDYTPSGIGSLGKRMPRYSRWVRRHGLSLQIVSGPLNWLAERRVTVVILAACLFRHDHHRWPATLDALVPQYLPAVPRDPFFADGRPLGYVVKPKALPDGSDRPLVYYDFEDNPLDVMDSEPTYAWNANRDEHARRDLRQYRDLAIWLPAQRRFDVKKLAEAVDQNPDESDKPREDSENNDGSETPTDQ